MAIVAVSQVPPHSLLSQKVSIFIERFVFFNVSVTDIYFVVLIPGAFFIGAAFVGFLLDFFDEMRNSFSK
jgi:hypothetical protein